MSTQRMWNSTAIAALLLAALSVHSGEPVAPPAVPPVAAKEIQMNFKDMPLETVLEQLSEMTGLIVVKDVTVEGRISVISKQPMNVDEALILLNAVLKEKGYVGIRTGRILKLVKLDEAKKRNIPVRTGNDPAHIADTDEVITQVIPVKYIDAAQLKKDFTPLIATYADLSANAGSNTLIMTDTSSNIKRVVEIIRAMDQQSTVVTEVKVFQLKYANSASAARLINEIFKDDDQQQNQRNQQQRFGPGGFFGGPGGGGRGGRGGGGENQENSDEQAQRVKKVQASADERTNAVVVSASPDVLPLVAQVIKELDSNPAEEQAVFHYRCKNAQAVNLESVLNAVFGVTSGITRSGTQTRTSAGVGTDVQRGASSQRSTGGGTSTLGTGGGGTFGGGGNFGGGFNGGNFGGGNNQGRRGNTGSSATAGDLYGQVYTVADIDSNSLIILTASKNFDRVKKIIEELDKPVPQVFIKVLIAEVTHSKDTDVGVDASILNNGAVVTALTDFGVSSATGGLITKAIQGDFSATLKALDTVGKLEILSRPYILASDNQLSSITVGQEVPFIVSSRTTETGQTVNTIQYQDIGIILNVTAHINEEGLVILDVAPEVSSLTGNTVPISENVSAPVFAKRSAQSRVGIQDGKTIVIGGLMEDRKTETENGIPMLRKIPGLGTLFRRKMTTKAKTELLIFLTPHVAQDPSQLKRMTEEEEARLRLVPGAVRPKAYPEHKEGMGRRAEIVPDELTPKEKRRIDPASDVLPIP